MGHQIIGLPWLMQNWSTRDNNRKPRGPSNQGEGWERTSQRLEDFGKESRKGGNKGEALQEKGSGYLEALSGCSRYSSQACRPQEASLLLQILWTSQNMTVSLRL